MATPNVGILTNAGKNLIDQVNAGQTKITFSKIVFSSMDNNQLTDDQIKALTTVAPQEIVVNNPKVTLDNNTGETRIRATGNNEALTDGVYVKTYAVYAKDDSGNEILYGITVSPNPNYLPEYDGVTPQAVTYSYKVNISNTSNITFANSNDIYVSDTDLAEALQPYAKTVDVNQQLDKKVNIADMRKPASDVAGIEEVNAKQDKIGYTPADDSKVVHDNHDNTITASSSIYDLSKSGLTPLQLVSSGSFNDLPLGTVMVDGTLVTDGPDTIHGFTTTTFYFSDWVGRKVQIAIADNTNIMYFRICNVTIWNNWVQLADDSKVAHLSGANNFDTVPTVNNNPLLLASSLPSDLARTGSDQEFTGKNTFDTAPIDKTTGNPYITKDGVPSDVARTSQQTNFTAGLQSGGVDVATAADLKSVEDSAWRELDLSGTSGIYTGKILIKIDQVNKYVYFIMNAQIPRSTYSPGTKIIDLSNVVTGLSSAHGYLQGWVANRENPYSLKGSTISFSGACLIIGDSYSVSGVSRIATEADPNKQYCYAVYDDLVNS